MEGPEFEAWVLVHQARLLRTAWLLTGDPRTAEDLVQATLERCWVRWARVRRADDVEAYVRRVQTTLYASWWRRRWRGEVPTAELPDRPAPAGDDEDGPALLAALARLPRGQRAVVVLRFAEDLSEAQTADALGVSVGTVKSQTSRALRALRADRVLGEETDRAWTS